MNLRRVLFLATAGLCLGELAYRIQQGRLRRRRTLERSRLLVRHDHGYARVVDLSELSDLPGCVQRYFRYALSPGQLTVRSVRMLQKGALRLGKNEWSWQPFTAEQVVSTRPAGFIWNAVVRMPLGINIHVVDSYFGFEGETEAELGSLIRLAKVSGRSEVATAALLRFLAEAVWYPTALLPSAGVNWRESGENRAVARLVDGENSVELEFRFDPGGPVVSVFSSGRNRLVKGHFELTPWEGLLFDYELNRRMMVPMRASVRWHLPEGTFPVWEGELQTIQYDFGRF